ncbi:MAG: alpha/beta fold hydrolase [Betaproteobacteria bacterium]|nr:MAG: alpha/beta fold hydrolase [Betaproteobacteria bacterium]
MHEMILRCIACVLALPFAAAAQTPAPAMGMVVMHGKGGMPGGLVNTLAEELARKGYLVANLEMPWSGRRNYDRDVAAADQEVTAALDDLRGKGANRVFVAGHSQGGVYALHYAGRHPLDGLIIIAPGGNVATAFYQGKVGGSVSRARSLVAAGKGDERGEFDEFEGGKGNWTVRTTAAIYLSWFDPEGAMNQDKSSRALPKSLPVLHVAPRSDYPALLRSKQEMFDALPAHPLKRLYEPNTDHRGAPAASVEEIIRWTAEVAARQ